MTEIREKALDRCEALISERLRFAETELESVGSSMEGEIKSSAGDKHETARTRMQHEQERIHTQVSRHRCELEDLKRIRSFGPNEKPAFGSLVKTNRGFFLIAVPSCRLHVEDIEIRVVSPTSPFGKLLMGMDMNADFSANGEMYRVLAVY
jgi:hypothetical protein